MATTVLQTVVSRLREDFTTTSATAVLVAGTQRLLTVTAGSYVDLSAVVGCSIGAAADAFMNVYVDGAISGEGGSGSVGTAGDFLEMAARTRVGPITTAQAAAGILVDVRVATSASTLSISATTTPSKYSAVLTATELTITNATDLPKKIPHLLLWLKADTGVTKSQSTGDVTAWADQSGSGVITFSTLVNTFTPGETLTGGTSGATAVIQTGGATKSILTDIRGTFVVGEAISSSGTGTAVVTVVPAALSIVATAGTSPKYEASVVNSLPGLYFDGARAAHFTINNDGVLTDKPPLQGTSIEIFAVVSVSAALRAGASLLVPAVASKADCLAVTLSNATVNRNALLDTGNAGTPEYVSTTTTITSGKALMRWRYNLGTTTGAAGVDGNAEVADTTFAPADPGTIYMGTIGSPSAGDFPIGDFRLCELLVYSYAQPATADAVSSSDIQAIRDYLNSKYRVY